MALAAIAVMVRRHHAAVDGCGEAILLTGSKADYLRHAARGGFPEVVLHRTTDRRRAAWFESYVTGLVRREARGIAGVERPRELRQLLRLPAARSAQLLKIEELARDAGLPPPTARRHLRLLEAAFIIRTVPGWATSRPTRAVRAPKLYVCHTGLRCHLLGVSASAPVEPGRLPEPLPARDRPPGRLP